MKNYVCLYVLAMFLVACNSKELDRDTALKLLKGQSTSPKIVEEDIYVADPMDAKRVLDAGLEREGLVVVQKTQSLADAGKPLITFTEKAKPYLITQTDKDRQDNIQRVKIADETIEEVTGIQMQEGDNQAQVEYTTSFNNITPFSKLSKMDLNVKGLRYATFSLYDDWWRIDKM